VIGVRDGLGVVRVGRGARWVLGIEIKIEVPVVVLPSCKANGGRGGEVVAENTKHSERLRIQHRYDAESDCGG
jgi:hypothetical protein